LGAVSVDSLGGSRPGGSRLHLFQGAAFDHCGLGRSVKVNKPDDVGAANAGHAAAFQGQPVLFPLASPYRFQAKGGRFKSGSGEGVALTPPRPRRELVA
jgi:hypothetical protein